MDLPNSSNIVMAIVSVTFLLLVLASFIIMLLMVYQKRKKEYHQEKQLMQSTFTQTLLQTRLEIQEETFRNISQEIHDNIGQALSFVKLSINTIDGRIPADIKEKLVESKDLLSKTIQDLRDIARSLNPDFIAEIGLPDAIQQQLQILEKTGQYKTIFTVNGEAYKNDQQRELVVFRIVQELLNNIVKHAEANAVTITMDYGTDKLTITVQDNGKGFDITAMQSAENNHGLGLRNMLSRMTLITGFITVNSKPAKGTAAIIELPKPPIS